MTQPASYDFDRTFAPLPVLNQGQAPKCWAHQWANHLRAFGLIYDRRQYRIDPMTLFETPTGPCDSVFTAGDRTFRVRNESGCTGTYWPAKGGEQEPAALRDALLRNGIMQAAVPAYAHSFARAYGPRLLGRHLKRRRLPVIVPSDHDGPTAINHSVLIVGYHRRGLICLNSWGRSWGKDGRAILSWEWIKAYGVHFEVDTYDGHPVDGLNLGGA